MIWITVTADMPIVKKSDFSLFQLTSIFFRCFLNIELLHIKCFFYFKFSVFFFSEQCYLHLLHKLYLTMSFYFWYSLIKRALSSCSTFQIHKGSQTFWYFMYISIAKKNLCRPSHFISKKLCFNGCGIYPYLLIQKWR